MSILVMLGWWYGQGWIWAFSRIGHQLENIGKVFAVGILLKTLFSPWKQIQTQGSFQTFFQTLVDNTISRLIGFIVRFFMLMFAGVWAVFVMVSGIILIIVWPLIPLSIIIFPILFVSGVSF